MYVIAQSRYKLTNKHRLVYLKQEWGEYEFEHRLHPELHYLIFPQNYPLADAENGVWNGIHSYELKEFYRIYCIQKLLSKPEVRALFAADSEIDHDLRVFHLNMLCSIDGYHATLLCAALIERKEAMLEILLADSGIDVNLPGIRDDSSQFIMTPLELLIGMSWLGDTYVEYAKRWITRLIKRDVKLILHLRFHMGPCGKGSMFRDRATRIAYGNDEKLDLLRQLSIDKFSDHENKILWQFRRHCARRGRLRVRTYSNYKVWEWE